MIDRRGYRLNVGIIIANKEGKLFWGRRPGHKDAWQFPQGGVNNYETLEETMLRELNEEVGLNPEDIEIVGVTRRWLYYQLPYRMRRHHQQPLCIGQKQKWFLLMLVGDEKNIHFENTEKPEFTDWCWVDYWHPLEKVISFKHGVYQRALKELEPLLEKEVNKERQ
ncbi:MAG: RNA pyrophosphohydrolase [Gammaproteobacteria bacterium]|nr:RNA pyrophosphohydrolase [Gammaproteobacteria bacterium]